MSNHRGNSILDVWKFIFCFFIVTYHSYYIGFLADYFSIGWIYVEFFFMCTGYYTAKHFSQPQSDSIAKYTLNKFLKIYPAVFVSVSIRYLLEAIHVGIKHNVFPLFQQYLTELLLLTSSGLSKPKLGPIWFLSAMFIVFPAFCCLLRYGSKICPYVCWLIPALLTGAIGIGAHDDGLYDLLRAFSSLCLGVGIFYLSEKLRQCALPHPRAAAVLLTVVEFGCFLTTMYMSFKGSSATLLMLYLFIVGLTLLFSKKTYSCKIHIPFSPYLGKFSAILFLMHWDALYFVDNLVPKQFSNIFTYFALCILLSLLFLVASEWVGRQLKKRGGAQPSIA